MVLDEKGKLFGKISIADIIFILIVLVLIGGIYIKFFNKNKNDNASFDTIQFSVFVKSVREPTIDAVIVGEEAYEESTNIYLGQVINKEVFTAKDYIEKTDGTIVLAEKPGKYDIIITFEVPGIENNIGYFANGNKEIKKGSDLKVKTKLFSVESRVKSVSIK